jgi:preprotein translocase subunit SecD
VRWDTASGALVKPSLPVVAIGIGIGIAVALAACTGTAPRAATASAGTASAAAPVHVSRAQPAQQSGPAVEIRLTPVHGAEPAVLAAAVRVLRRRATLLGLRDTEMSVSGREIVLTGPEPGQSTLASLLAGGTFGLRPVLLSAPYSAAGQHGDARQVSTAARKLFGKLVCRPGPSSGTVDDSWQATVGYSPDRAQWDVPDSQIVSCDASGNRYVLASAVVVGAQVTFANAGLASSSDQWVVFLTLDSAATKAFGTFTTRQYAAYAPGAQAGNADDEALDSTAIVLDGDVLGAPETVGPITTGLLEISGPTPDGFTQAAARGLAATLGSGPLPVGLQVASVKVLGQAAA